MEKEYKTKDVFEIDHDDWPTYERIRLIKKGKDINKFVISADPDFNEGTILCEDYTMKFNRDECAIDLVVNGALDSPIWKDVIENVPVQFASYLDCNSNFVFHFSTNIGDEMGFYEYAFCANGRPVFAMVSDVWAAPIIERCFYQ